MSRIDECNDDYNDGVRGRRPGIQAAAIKAKREEEASLDWDAKYVRPPYSRSPSPH